MEKVVDGVVGKGVLLSIYCPLIPCRKRMVEKIAACLLISKETGYCKYSASTSRNEGHHSVQVQKMEIMGSRSGDDMYRAGCICDQYLDTNNFEQNQDPGKHALKSLK